MLKADGYTHVLTLAPWKVYLLHIHLKSLLDYNVIQRERDIQVNEKAQYRSSSIHNAMQWQKVEAECSYPFSFFIATIGSSLIWHVWEHWWNLASKAFKFLGFIIRLRDDVIFYTPSLWAMHVVCESSVWPSCSTAMQVLTLLTSIFLFCYPTALYRCLV